MNVASTRLVFAMLAVAAVSIQLQAASFWDGGGGADHSWTNPLNWVPDGNPGATTDVIFASGITPGLTIELLSGVNNSANTITISTLNTFTIHSNNGAGIFLNSGNLTRQDIAGSEGNVTIDAPVSINANANWDISGFGFFTVGALFETGATRSFTKNGGGFLEIKNVGYSGVTTLNSGTLRLDGNSSTSSINAAFGTTLEFTGFNTLNPNTTVTLGGAAPAIRNVSGDSSVGRIVFTAPFGDEIDLDSGSLTVKNGINAPAGTAWVKFGSGLMAIAGTSNLDNSTLVGGGKLRALSPNALGTSVVNVPAASTLDVATNLFNTVNVAGTLSSDFGGALTGQVNLTNNITLNATNFLGLVGSISDNGNGFGITKTGTGLAQLSGLNNFLGPITVTAGNLRVNSFLPSSIATTVQNGATIELFDNGVNRPLSIIGAGAGGIGALSGLGTALWAGPITLQGDTSFGSGSNAVLNVSGPISGNFNLTKIGPGTLTLTNSSNTFASLTIAEGRLILNSPSALPTSKPITVNSGGNLELADNGIYDRPLSLAGFGGVAFPNALFNASGNNTWSGPITLAADASIAAADGRLTLAGNPSATPPHNLSVAGPGEIVLSGNLSGVSVQVTSGTAFYNGATVTGGFLRGPGTHAITGVTSFGGVTALAGNNITQSASTTLNNFTNAGNLISSAPLVWDGGFNTAAGALTINNTANVSGFENTGTITINNGGNLINSGNTLTSGGGGRITINSGGQLNLGATSLDLNGSLLINNGIINGTTNVNFGALAKGSGVYRAINITDGGRFSPGNSPGTVTTGSTSWNSGGVYAVEFGATAHDFWQINGQLNLRTSAAHPFVIALEPLDDFVFDNTRDYTWPILTAADGIDFTADQLALDVDGFKQDCGSGQFSLQSTQNELLVHFSAVPEPAGLPLVLGASVIGISRLPVRRQSC